jgi:hypothetical protein
MRRHLKNIAAIPATEWLGGLCLAALIAFMCLGLKLACVAIHGSAVCQ